MSAPELPTVALAEAPVNDGLREPLEALVRGGYGCYIYQSPHRRRHASSWFLIERDGNTGTVQHTGIDGYKVLFSIDPRRKYGSSLLVGVPRPGRDDRDPLDVADILVCAHLATEQRYKNFAVPRPLLNDGWAHFAWAIPGLLRVVA